jgi:hypothetical protein
VHFAEADKLLPSNFEGCRDLLNQAFKGQMEINCKATPKGFSSKIVLTNPSPVSATLLYLKIMWIHFYDEVFEAGTCLLASSDVIPPHKITDYSHLDNSLKRANEVLSKFLPLDEVYRFGGFTVNQALHSHEDADVVKAYRVVLAWLKFLQVWKAIEFAQPKGRGKRRLKIRFELHAVAALLRRHAALGGLTSEDVYERFSRMPGSGFLHH